jgi:hypothetical protein
MRVPQVTDAVAQRGVLIVRDVKRVLEDRREDREPLLFQFTMLLVQLFEPLFGRGGGACA